MKLHSLRVNLNRSIALAKLLFQVPTQVEIKEGDNTRRPNVVNED